MGKYLSVIRTAECGSLNRAAQALGYTQPSLAYIINNIESELGVKIFYRDQRGVTLTEEGTQLLAIMRQIEEMEEKLRQAAQLGQNGVLRVGIFPSVASLWLPGILQLFYAKHPDVAVRLEHQFYYLDGEKGVKEHRLDCAFFTGNCPPGLDRVELYEDPYYLMVNSNCELANLEEATTEAVVGKYLFIPTHESFDSESAIWDVYHAFEKSNLVESQPQENRMAVAMVEAGLGITILPGLDLIDLLPGRGVKAIPMAGGLSRTVSILCPRETERNDLVEEFLGIVQSTVENWKQTLVPAE